MQQVLPVLIMGFREGLEAFLIIGIILRVLDARRDFHLKPYVWKGSLVGVAASLVLGWVLFSVGSSFNQVDGLGKLWEASASLLAMVLVTTFIIWMIQHGERMASHVKQSVEGHLGSWSLLMLSAVMVAREGAEIAIFAFAGEYSILGIGIGISSALLLTVFVFRSMVKVSLSAILQITLLYLVLQAGYLVGYGIHEGLSGLKEFGVLSKDSLLFSKAFDVSKTVLNHKDGAVGLPLNVLFGWYSKPEWIQFIAQYAYTFLILAYWWRQRSNKINRNA